MTAAEHKAPRADRRRIVRLTDLLAVVVLIAILSTLLGPQFSIASSTPLQNALRHELDRLSKQVALYRLQHDNQSPGMTADGLSASKFVEDLTRDDRFGPYLNKMPDNPINRKRTVRFIGEGPIDAQLTGAAGWVYQPSTGRIAPDTPGPWFSEPVAQPPSAVRQTTYAQPRAAVPQHTDPTRDIQRTTH